MKKLIISLIVLAAVAGSVGAYYKYRDSAAETKVSTLPVAKGDIVESVGATGTVQAVTTVQVGTQVSGNIMALYADFNSIVRKGQIVAKLDPSLFDTQIAQARANLVRAQADVERLKVSLDDARNTLARTQNLADRKLVSAQELESAQVAVRAAEAQLKSSDAAVVQSRASLNQNEVNMQHTVIEAPIDGIVISRNVDVGQTVAASMSAPTIFVIAADLTKMQVNASVDESDVGRIRPGQVVRFRVDAYPFDEFIGAVSQVRLQPIVSQNVVTYATVIDVPNPQLKLKPGMTANVTIEIARRNDVLRVPNAALRFRPTADTFTALNQPLPPEMQRTTDGAARSGGSTQGGSGDRPGGAGPRPAATGASGLGTTGSPGQAASLSGSSMPAGRATRPGATGTAFGSGPASSIANRPTAQTIDQLFGPLPPTVSSSRAWMHVNGQLKSVRLRLGITDGTYTELLSGEIQAGQELVTSVITPAQAAAAATRSPLTPAGPGGQRPGAGNPMGGARGGPGGH